VKVFRDFQLRRHSLGDRVLPKRDHHHSWTDLRAVVVGVGRDGYVVFQEWQDYLNEQYKAESADPYYYSSSYGTQGRKK
jgi:hypothetical protein